MRAASTGWRSWLPRVLVESALIVFSVFLALALDEWRDNRTQDEQAAMAQAEILEEIRANRLLVEEARRYHSMLLDSLADHRASSSSPPVRLFSRGFVSPAQLSHTAWTSAAETGALSHMDYPTVLRLSRVYARQDRYATQANSISELLYAELYRGGTSSVVESHLNLAALIETFRYRESQLLGLFDQTLSGRDPPN